MRWWVGGGDGVKGVGWPVLAKASKETLVQLAPRMVAAVEVDSAYRVFVLAAVAFSAGVASSGENNRQFTVVLSVCCVVPAIMQ